MSFAKKTKKAGFLWLAVVTLGLLLALSVSFPASVQPSVSAATPIPENPDDDERDSSGEIDGVDYEDEIPSPLEILGVLIMLFLVLIIAFSFLLIFAGSIIGILFLLGSAIVGTAALVAVVKKKWKDGLLTLFGEFFVIVFTFSGVAAAWILHIFDWIKLDLWLVLIIGAVFGFSVGLAAFITGWQVIKSGVFQKKTP